MQSQSESPPAYLLDLTVRNVRCFGPEEQTLRLSDAQGRPAPWTVILGDNGVGKTTLLQCLVALEPRRHFVRLIQEEERPLVELPTGGGDGWRIYRDLSQPGETSIRGHVALGPIDRPRETVEVVVPTSSVTSRALVVSSAERSRLLELQCNGYGATRRMGSAALTRSPGDSSASLFLDDVSLIDVEEWLLAEDYARSRSATKEAEWRLERVKTVLIDLLPDVRDIRIGIGDPLRGFPRPAIEVKTPYGWVSISDLSLGYRAMIAWTVDLASRLFALHPESPNPLAEPAVVLVDEVDLHLHPKWQRELRSHLTERFPATQFVVTAHSPLVVQASENENIVVLRRQGDHVIIDNDVETVHGWRVDQVLTSDLFGLKTARPPQYDELIARRNTLLDKRSLDAQDRTALDKLEAQIAELPAGERPEDLRAMEIIQRAAAKLEGR
ncbi:MAG TPA: AAA family ATPase [Thermoanaerobaculia bacterium]|nr:AAA family ATPase [Thermoanaerobaculia bacterium]